VISLVQFPARVLCRVMSEMADVGNETLEKRWNVTEKNPILYIT